MDGWISRLDLTIGRVMLLAFRYLTVNSRTLQEGLLRFRPNASSCQEVSSREVSSYYKFVDTVKIR